ncbi:MAG: hypothetical protein AAGI34_15260, partial [Pseudomonadota bacterium]
VDLKYSELTVADAAVDTSALLAVAFGADNYSLTLTALAALQISDDVGNSLAAGSDGGLFVGAASATLASLGDTSVSSPSAGEALVYDPDAGGPGIPGWTNAVATSGPAPVVPLLAGAASDEASDLATATGALTLRALGAGTLTEVRASVTTAPVGALIVVDIKKNGASILSTPLTIDDGETTSTTAATPAVLSDIALADDDQITVDITQVGSTTAGAGLKIALLGTRP